MLGCWHEDGVQVVAGEGAWGGGGGGDRAVEAEYGQRYPATALPHCRLHHGSCERHQYYYTFVSCCDALMQITFRPTVQAGPYSKRGLSLQACYGEEAVYQVWQLMEER